MKYKIKQYYRYIEPVIYTDGYVNYGTSIQVLENIANSENKELEFESSLNYQIGEHIAVNGVTFAIENIIKPMNDTECIELILEDEVEYCDDYGKNSIKIIEDFKSYHMYATALDDERDSWVDKALKLLKIK